MNVLFLYPYTVVLGGRLFKFLHGCISGSEFIAFSRVLCYPTRETNTLSRIRCIISHCVLEVSKIHDPCCFTFPVPPFPGRWWLCVTYCKVKYSSSSRDLLKSGKCFDAAVICTFEIRQSLIFIWRHVDSTVQFPQLPFCRESIN